jgi:hypothetical protein
MMRNKEMTMWFETMTYEEKWYRYLLRTGGSAAAIADALEKFKAVRGYAGDRARLPWEKEIDDGRHFTTSFVTVVSADPALRDSCDERN